MNNVVFLSEHDVNQLVSMKDAVQAVDSAARSLAAGEASIAPRSRSTLGGLNLNLLGGSQCAPGAVGAKIYVTGGHGAKFWGMLFDSAGTLLMVYEADRLGQLRTGAASGVSARTMARLNSKTLAVIGAGYQARAQVEAILHCTSIKEVRVYSRTRSKAEMFAREIHEAWGVVTEAPGSVEQAVQDADIVVTMTTSSEPIIQADHVRAGVHYIFAGSNNPNHAEASPQALEKIDVLTTDDVDQAKSESGTLRRAMSETSLDWSDVVSLPEVLVGSAKGRSESAQATAFVSHGIGLWDTALAAVLYERAQEQTRGIELPFGGAPEEGRR